MYKSPYKLLRHLLLFVTIMFMWATMFAQKTSKTTAQAKPATIYKNLSYLQLVNAFKRPPESAKPWVFWYWMNAAVSKAGITADLESMKQAAIGGAYLMPIKDTTKPPIFKPVVRQLTPAWWAMMRFAMKEADRLGLKIAMHVSDGFALAGGPWITPELSMQKVVWSQKFIEGGRVFNDTLPPPEKNEGYYKDIAVYAFPTLEGADVSTQTVVPKVTTSKGTEASFLVMEGNKQNFSSDDTCWIQYAFEQPFTARSIVIKTNGNNYQAHRLMIEVSEDGVDFRSVGRLQPPRHGWQDTDEDVTHSIASTTAKYFRFIYNKAGSEPGSEDLDAAKWRPALKIRGIELSGAARINQYEGKNGSIWRVSKRTTEEQVPVAASSPLNKVINITQYLSADGRLKWNAPAGKWTLIRIGHTSTGHTNATGGGGIGLECDKFSEQAITKQFNGWFGEAVKQAGPELAAKVLKIFHIDSWECGSQNWSPVFAEEFRKRRGYDILTYLPVMAGIPVESADVSEKFLHDVRQTIAELVVDKFYVTMARLAKAKGCTFTAESVAPTMLSDGLMHYKTVDIPMGEFWLNSPTHDKPNDMMDAISGAHIYGKPIIQAEAFTTVRMDWSEHPGMLKTVQDRNYALGINKLVYHVFTHNPWMDRKPGMTLDGVGLYFQRDQPWWKAGRAWVQYAQRCQSLLQVGRPVVDIAVFTGEELPRRSVLPDRLVSTLPGIFGEEIVSREAERLANRGEPLREMPAGVRHSANMADPEDWIDPLRGYAYDSFNPDALLTAKVNNGRVEFPGGASYKILVLPQPHQMFPDNNSMSGQVAQKLLMLVKDGATLILNGQPSKTTTLFGNTAADKSLESITNALWRGQAKGYAKYGKDTIVVGHLGSGRIINGPYTATSFEAFGITPDFIAIAERGQRAENIAWTHRTLPGSDIYFVSNQSNTPQTIEVSLRIPEKVPELWDPVTGQVQIAQKWRSENFRTILPVKLDANASVFIVLSKATSIKKVNLGTNWTDTKTIQKIAGPWQVRFNKSHGGPAAPVLFPELRDWTTLADSSIKYYSGTAVYKTIFNWSDNNSTSKQIFLDLEKVENMAEIRLNGINCGVAWTPPYRVNITNALKIGSNKLEIEVSNTWANRLIGDHRLSEENRITQTSAPFRLAGKPLLPAGLIGGVSLSEARLK